MQGGLQNYPYFSLLIFSKKIITESLSSEILQTRLVEVVWHQDGSCSLIFSAQKAKHFGKLRFTGNFLGDSMQEDDSKDCWEI